MLSTPFSTEVKPDGEAFIDCLKRKGTPKRVHNIELFLDVEIQDAIARRFGIGRELNPADPFFPQKRLIALQRFLGYDYVTANVNNLGFKFDRLLSDDPSELKRIGGKRSFAEEHKGPVTNWEEFEKYQWPDLSLASTRDLEWYQKNLPEDMVLIGGLTGHIAEEITWLMGYETLCYTLYEDRALVKAIYDKVFALHKRYTEILLQFSRIRIVWGSDDMGFKTGPMFSPADMREFVFPAHKALAKMVHDAGRIYFLHACGKLDLLIDDLINDVKIDAKHSFEDTIENVSETKARYGGKIALLGGIDVDFLCRADEKRIRERVRRTLEQCHPGGGYCLGTGNSVANYIPVDNYLTMMDEGRKFLN